MSTLSVNGKLCTKIRKVTPWTGTWIAYCDVDDAPLTGKATIQIDEQTLVGTIDARYSGKIGERSQVAVIGGGGAWDRILPPKHWHNDGGVLRATVVNATASEVGEVFASGGTERLGTEFVRVSGPASRVFASLPWYVDDAGKTHARTRTSAAPPPDVQISDFDQTKKVAHILSGSIVQPGWKFADDRFGEVTLRDVEQTWTAEGARATAWCSPQELSRLSGLLASAVREFAGIAALKSYRYRVFQMAGDKVQLQAVRRSGADHAPDLVPCEIMFGVPGAEGELTPGQEVTVDFEDGDPSKPMVRSFKGKALTLTFDATTKIDLGIGATPVAHAAQVIACVDALAAALAAIGTGLTAIAGPLAGPAAGAVVTTAAGAATSAIASAKATLATTKVNAQ
jgi:hypothetical protein